MADDVGAIFEGAGFPPEVDGLVAPAAGAGAGGVVEVPIASPAAAACAIAEERELIQAAETSDAPLTPFIEALWAARASFVKVGIALFAYEAFPPPGCTGVGMEVIL